jgi:hypothetical protein
MAINQIITATNQIITAINQIITGINQIRHLFLQWPLARLQIPDSK